MSVSIQESGGRRGKRSLDTEFNLVPFIDLLCSLISFLLMTAVWMQISSLELKQGSDTSEATEPKENDQIDLRIHIHERGFTVVETTTQIPIPCTTEICSTSSVETDSTGKQTSVLKSFYDYDQLQTKLKEEKERFVAQKNVSIILADGIPYNEMIKTMDTCLGVGLDGISLSGTML